MINNKKAILLISSYCKLFNICDIVYKNNIMLRFDIMSAIIQLFVSGNAKLVLWFSDKFSLFCEKL